jgi:two-component system NarL family sensor kinase
MKKTSLFIFLLVVPVILVLSNSKVDSLYKQLQIADDSVKYLIYENIYRELRYQNTDSAIWILDEALEFSDKNNRPDKIAVFYNCYGHVYEHVGEIDLSMDYFQRSYDILYQLGEFENAVISLNNLGAMLMDAAKYDQAGERLFQALSISDSLNFVERKSITLHNIGMLFHHQQQWEKAIAYYEKAIIINKELQKLKSVALQYNNIGIIYYYMGIMDSVLVNFERSLDMYIALGDKKGQTRPLFNIAEIYSEKGEYSKALDYYERSIQLEKELGYKKGYAESMVYIGNLYAQLNNFNKALSYQREGLEILEELKYPREIADAYQALSETFRKMDMYDSALVYYISMSAIKDSLFTVEKSKQISELEAIYENEKKEKEILQLEKVKSRDKFFKSILIAVVVIMIMLVVFLIIYSKMREKTALQKAKNLQQTTQFKAVIEAQENERKRIAGELHDSVGPLLSLTQLYISDLSDSIDAKNEEDKVLLDKSQKILQEACDETRNISHNLMPGVLIRLGLVSAMRELINKVKGSNQFDISFESDKIESRFDEGIEITYYRVLQELLNNIIKHAGANNIKVSLHQQEDSLNLCVSDNGKGFNIQQLEKVQGIGWKNIYSRVSLVGGKIKLNSGIKGTNVEIVTPVT